MDWLIKLYNIIWQTAFEPSYLTKVIKEVVNITTWNAGSCKNIMTVRQKRFHFQSDLRSWQPVPLPVSQKHRFSKWENILWAAAMIEFSTKQLYLAVASVRRQIQQN